MRTFLRVLSRADSTLEPANDPHTRHKSLDDLAAIIQRAKCDLLRARTAQSDAEEAVTEAQSDYDAACNAFTDRLAELDLIDKPVVECPEAKAPEGTAQPVALVEI